MLDFLSEAQILASFNHNNIIKLLGVVTIQEPLLMVLEHVPYGSIRDVLKACRTKGLYICMNMAASL